MINKLIELTGLGGKVQLAVAASLVLIVLISTMSIAAKLRKVDQLQAEIERRNINELVMEDSMRQVTNLNGELEAVRLTLVTNAERLEKYNEELAEELQKERGKVRTIVKTETVIKRDTVHLSNEVTRVGDAYTLKWNNDTVYSEGNYRRLKGFSTFVWDGEVIGKNRTTILSDEIAMRLITGITERQDGMLETFVRTDFPGVTFNVESAVIDPQAYSSEPRIKKWGIGPIIGYDPFDNRIIYGIGLQRNFIRF